MTVASRVGLVYPAHETSDQGPFVPSRFLHKRLAQQAICWPLQIGDGVDVAAVPNLFSIGTLTNGTVAAGGTWDGSAVAGSKFTDDTTDINSAATADVIVLPASEEDEYDWLHLAFSDLVFGINSIISTAGAGGVVAWEYLARNGTWVALPEVIDGSTSFTAGTSNYDTLWQIPNDWVKMAETEVSATEYYHVRARVTTVFSTNPALSRIQTYVVAAANVAAGLVAPATGVIDAVAYDCATDSGAAANTILQVLNHTRKTRGLVELTFGTTRERKTFSTELYVERGDEITIHPVQIDGTAEKTNFTGMMLEISQ